ncbi:hypothetical protein BB934_03805 [Microvirga ossetica]|uniref:Uncharacterized protein n=1 Tax=Microvirga ossetica TaxID=1882682 RepID=A0A1B2EBU0_9HYPH|nr:hypothetical protein BB934_03805 [Microvirga ossetica]
MAVGDYGQLLSTAATFLAWASLVALGIAWDAHVKFRVKILRAKWCLNLFASVCFPVRNSVGPDHACWDIL